MAEPAHQQADHVRSGMTILRDLLIQHEGMAQLYVRLTTANFDEAIRARRDRRPPVYED